MRNETLAPGPRHNRQNLVTTTEAAQDESGEGGSGIVTFGYTPGGTGGTTDDGNSPPQSSPAVVCMALVER